MASEKKVLDANDYPLNAIVQDPHPTDKLQNKVYKVVKQKDSSDKMFKVIGNFYLDVIAQGEDLQKRAVYLIDLNGKLIISYLGFTSSLQRFREFIRPFTFLGNSDDVEAIAEMILSNVRQHYGNEVNLISIKDFVGLYENDSISFWIFEDRILITKHQNKKISPPFQVLIPHDNSMNGIIKVEDLYICIEQNNINRSLIPQYSDPTGYDLIQFLKHWLSQIKNQTLLYSLLGWGISSLFLEHVNQLRKSRNFPFYVVTASTEAGKTALLNNCIKIFGVDYIGENFAAGVTRFVETIEFSRVSHLPIWRDEYKNEKYALEKEGWLRSVYTRSSSSRGDKDQSTHHYPTNATLILTGEDVTEDPALSRRMLKMRLRKQDKIPKDDFEKITMIATEHFAKVLPLLLAAKFDDAVFLDIFNDPENFLPDDSVMRDELMCYASLGAIFGPGVAHDAIQSAKEYHANYKNDAINEKQVTVDDFFSDLDAYFLERGWYDSQFNNKPRVLDYFYFPRPKGENGDIQTAYIRFLPLYNLVMKFKARDSYKWSKKAIAQLLNETYNAKLEARKFGKGSVDKSSIRVMVVNEYDKFTDTFGEILQTIKEISDAWSKSQINVLDPTSDELNDDPLPL